MTVLFAGFICWGSTARGRLASAGVIVVELVWLIDFADHRWKAIPGM
jgi:hypothetical protein